MLDNPRHAASTTVKCLDIILVLLLSVFGRQRRSLFEKFLGRDLVEKSWLVPSPSQRCGNETPTQLKTCADRSAARKSQSGKKCPVWRMLVPKNGGGTFRLLQLSGNGVRL